MTTTRPRPHTSTVIAAVLVALEGIALFVLAGVQVLAITRGDTASLESAWALIALTVVFGVGVLFFSYGVMQRRTWGRSGSIVVQLLTGAIALGAATGQFAHPSIALWIALPAAITLIMVLASSYFDSEDGHRSKRPAPGSTPEE